MIKHIRSAMDLFGITASIICAIHCLATSTAIALLPRYGGKIWTSDSTHQVLAGVVVLFCLLSIYQSYRKHHDKKVLTLFAAGLFFVLTATFLLPEGLEETYEALVLCFGSFTLVAAHTLNIRRAVQCCKIPVKNLAT